LPRVCLLAAFRRSAFPAQLVPERRQVCIKAQARPPISTHTVQQAVRIRRRRLRLLVPSGTEESRARLISSGCWLSSLIAGGQQRRASEMGPQGTADMHHASASAQQTRTEGREEGRREVGNAPEELHLELLARAVREEGLHDRELCATLLQRL